MPRRPRPPPRRRRPSDGQHARRECPGDERPGSRPQPHGSEPDRRERRHRARRVTWRGSPRRSAAVHRARLQRPRAGRGHRRRPGQAAGHLGDDGGAKYILGPVVVSGDKISDATSGYQSQPAGQRHQRGRDRAHPQRRGRQAVRRHQPQDGGAARAAEPARRHPRLPGHRRPRGSTRRSSTAAPASPAGSPSTRARSLADQLKFGALPLSFVVQTQHRHHAPRSAASSCARPARRPHRPAARRRLLAVPVPRPRPRHRRLARRGRPHHLPRDHDARAGRTTTASTMAGVTGLIVAIGFTADSFIVYFERIRDELRDGRSLVAAVETGWNRARRTILVADGVNFLAAAVLYVLAARARARLRLHARPDDADRPARRLPLHPPRRARSSPAPVLPRRPQVVRPRPAAPRRQDVGPLPRARPVRGTRRSAPRPRTVRLGPRRRREGLA